MSQVTRAPGTKKTVPTEMKARSRVPLSRIANPKSSAVPPARKSTSTRCPQQKVSMTPTNSDSVSPNTSILHTNDATFKFTPLTIGQPNDPSDVIQYENIIYRTMRIKEQTMKPLTFHQTEITLKDRNCLIDAICRYHYKLSLTTNTLYRFIGIFDRFLSSEDIPKKMLKVYGCAAFLIASKIEDIYPAQSTDLVKLSEKAFTQRELFAAEIFVINAIGFDTTFPTPLFFLTHFMRIEDHHKESLLLARYILEAMQTAEQFYGMKASLMASIAIYATRMINGATESWPSSILHYTMYNKSDMIQPSDYVRAILLEENREETRFMRKKYGSELFLFVARVSIPTTYNMI